MFELFNFEIFVFSLNPFYYSRVHISARTKDYLNNQYELEPGMGEHRDQYLREHNVETFFIRQDKPTKWNPLKVILIFFTIK